MRRRPRPKQPRFPIYPGQRWLDFGLSAYSFRRYSFYGPRGASSHFIRRCHNAAGQTDEEKEGGV